MNIGLSAYQALQHLYHNIGACPHYQKAYAPCKGYYDNRRGVNLCDIAGGEVTESEQPHPSTCRWHPPDQTSSHCS